MKFFTFSAGFDPAVSLCHARSSCTRSDLCWPPAAPPARSGHHHTQSEFLARWEFHDPSSFPSTSASQPQSFNQHEHLHGLNGVAALYTHPVGRPLLAAGSPPCEGLRGADNGKFLHNRFQAGKKLFKSRVGSTPALAAACCADGCLNCCLCRAPSPLPPGQLPRPPVGKFSVC